MIKKDGLQTCLLGHRKHHVIAICIFAQHPSGLEAITECFFGVESLHTLALTIQVVGELLDLVW